MGLATPATWTCDMDLHTRDMDLRHLRHGVATCELLKSCPPAWPRPGESLSPSAETQLHGRHGRRIRGDRNGYTCRISRWFIFKVAALAGGRNQPPAMGASSAQILQPQARPPQVSLPSQARRPNGRAHLGVADLTANVGSPSSKTPRAAVGPADDISLVPARKRTLLRHDEDLLLRLIHAYWDAQGMTHSDPQAPAKAIHAINYPNVSNSWTRGP